MSVTKNSKLKIVINTSILVLSIFAPLVALPFLSRVLGQNGFGLYLSVLSFTGFLVIFCDFGFNVSSAKRLALNQENHVLRSEIIITTTLIKLFLLIIASLFYALFIFSFVNYSRLIDSVFLVIFFLSCLAMQPAWYFIGAEKLIFNSSLVAMGRILPLGFLFYFVQDQDDLELAIQIQSVGMFLCCFASYLYIGIRENISFEFPSTRVLVRYVKEDYMLFFSNVLVGIYASFNAVLLGINSEFKQVGTYAGIERIFKTLESIIVSIGSLFFPYIAREIQVNKARAARSIKDIVKIYLSAGVIIIVISFLFGSKLLTLVYGSEFDSDTLALYIFMFVPLLGAIATAWSNLGLLILGKNTLVFKILLIGAILNLILILSLGSNFGAVAGAIAIFVATAAISFQMKFHLNRHITQSSGGA